MINKENMIAAILTKLAEYFGKPLTENQLEMYVEDLMDLDPNDVSRAADMYRKSSSTRGFPLPAQLKGCLGLSAGHDESARIASARILEAMSRYGYTNPERAQAFIGELGWRVVQANGGWASMCASVSKNEILPTLKAQWRELAASLSRLAVSGRQDEAPRMPAQVTGPVSISSVVSMALKGSSDAFENKTT